MTAALGFDAVRVGPVSAAAPPDGTVTVAHGRLAVVTHGIPRPTTFNGINAYQLTSDWGVNYGCGYGGWTTATLETFFASLHPGEFVRTWFFQSMATTNGSRNWAALDRLVSTASRFDVHLVATLANQNGQCDDGEWKAEGWYAGGFNRAAGGVTSYAQWVHDVVGRYGRTRSIAVWEPVNEPEPVDCTPGTNCYVNVKCPDKAGATSALVAFFTNIGGLVHYLAPEALVSDGGFGTGNCGTRTRADFDTVLTSPGIDITSYHDYSGGIVNPIDLSWRSRDAAVLGKASIVGESGVTGCASAEDRASKFRKKITGARNDGVSAYLLWWYGGDLGMPTCNSPIDTDSPSWKMLQGLDSRRPEMLPSPLSPTSGLQA